MTVNRPLSSYTNKTMYSEDPPILRSTVSVYANSAPFTKCKLVKRQNIPPKFPSFRIGLLVGGLQNGEIYYFDENGEINFTLPDGMTGTNYYLVVESSTLDYANAAYNRVVFAYSLQFVFAKYNTKIDGGKQAITFNNDTQPVAVYVNGDLQENVSFAPDTVQGTGSVEYASEYKKNHIEYEMQGTTSQPVVDVVKSLTSYTATEEDYTESSYARILRSADLIYLPTGTTSANVSLTNVSSLANVSSNITFLLMNQARTVVNVLYMNGASYSATVTEPFYIAIADEEDGTLKQSDYDTFIQHVGLKMVYNGENVQPSPTTPKPIQNANDNEMSVALHGKNLATAEQFCENFASYLKGVFDGRECVSFRQNNTGKFVLEGGFKPNTQYTISFDGFRKIAETNVGGNGSIFYIDYTDGTRDGLHITIDVWKHYVLTTKEGKTVKSIGQIYTDYRSRFYIDINTFMLQEGVVTDPVYEPYFRETVEIPTEITSTTDKPILNNGVALIDGTNVPLLFSEYDKLTVDRVNNEVIYHNGGYSKTLNGNEATGSSTTLSKVWVTIPFELTGDGFCNQFLSPTDFIFSNNLSFGDSGMAFPMSRFSSTNALAAFLAEQYNNGTPVVVLAQKETPTPYNITNTDLGQLLLNLDTQNQTNYFEITSNENAPQTPINFTFAKWGGKK